MNTLSLIAGATIRLSLVAGGLLAGQNDAPKSLQLAGAAHRTIGQTALPQPIAASIAQFVAR